MGGDFGSQGDVTLITTCGVLTIDIPKFYNTSPKYRKAADLDSLTFVP